MTTIYAIHAPEGSGSKGNRALTDSMPRPRMPYLQHERSRHGKMCWYVRLSRTTPRTRIKAAFGTPEFMREYQAVRSLFPHLKSAAPAPCKKPPKHRQKRNDQNRPF